MYSINPQQPQNNGEIISRHRLPRFYRIGLTVLWLAPITLLTLTMLLVQGWSLWFFDPRFLLLAGLMALPALYFWRAGVDVRQRGLVVRVHVPRYYAYMELDGWDLHEQREGRILTVWDITQARVLSFHAAHLSDLPVLLHSLREHVRHRH